MAYFVNNFGNMRLTAPVTVTIPTVNTWVPIPSGFAAGQINGFSFSGNSLVCQGAGTFLLVASASAQCGSNNQQVSIGYSVNGVVPPNVFGNTFLAQMSHPLPLVIHDTVVLALGDVIKMVVQNNTSATNLIISPAMMSIARLQR